jgi:hypothetical protein
MAVLCAPAAWAAQATVLWQADTQSTVSGYRVHYGTSSGTYTQHVDAGNTVSRVIDGLAPATTYYVAVTAYDVYGSESTYSAEAFYTTPAAPDTISAVSAPTGPAAGVTATAYSFSCSPATSSIGDPLQYRLHWGDGTVSGWTSSSPATAWKSWDAPGTFAVECEAASLLDPAVSALSPALVVAIALRDPLLFSDDFADGSATGDPDWKPVAGVWSVQGTAMYLVSPAASNTVTLPVSVAGISSGRLETRLALTKTYAVAPNAGLVFAYRDGSHYRYVTLSKTKITIGQVGPTAAEKNGAKKVVLKALPLLTWMKVQVDFHPDGTVAVFLNGATTPVASYRFKDVTAGAVGYVSSKAKSYYDDFFLWDETVLN